MRWTRDRPGTLVVACSDGRLQRSIDAFLLERGLCDYDRLYLPGGPGALAACGEYLREDVARRELGFLVDAHQIQQLILVFHGAAAGGPEAAICADYRRKLFGRGREDICLQQERDAALLIRRATVAVRAFRAVVDAELAVHFQELA